MNKEYEPDWGQPAVRNPDAMAAAAKPASAAAVKQIVTIRLDVDMLDWFKSAGPGYQTRINQVLRAHMDEQRAAAAQQQQQ
jgi:uncharacterized protein (DUF4415 family)